MGTVIFDFDSTLISCESLEEILRNKLVNHPEMQNRIGDITAQGMEGRMTFQESLRGRLELTAPVLSDVISFGQKARDYLTPGMADLIRALQMRGVQVRIVSGALREAILPLAGELCIPEDRIHGVQLIWNREGLFAGIDPNDRFSVSKVQGLKSIERNLPKPTISIGDGMTDYAVYENGLVDHFIAFTQHVRRQAIIEKGVPEAGSVQELKVILEKWL